MMKSSTALLSLGLLFGTHANAAVMCIQNKATGLFEVKTEHGKLRPATAEECSLKTLQSALDIAPAKADAGNVARSLDRNEVIVPAPRAAVAAPAALLSATRTTGQAAAVVPAPAPKPTTLAAGVRTWSLKPEHRSIRDVIEDWAADAGGNGKPDEAVDVIWEARDFPLDLKKEKVLVTGTFRQAVELIGESFRDSDAAFQVQPTAFKQIVVIPMRKSTTEGMK